MPGQTGQGGADKGDWNMRQTVILACLFIAFFALISGEDTPLVDRYARKMGIADVFNGFRSTDIARVGAVPPGM